MEDVECGVWCGVVMCIRGVVWTTRGVTTRGVTTWYANSGMEDSVTTWCGLWCDHMVCQHGVVRSVTTWCGVVWCVESGVPVPYRIFIPHI